jgi:hypothetical protein
VLVDGMAALGFRPFLRPEVQAPIIVTFHAPAHPAYDFKRFYEGAKARGFMLYPGKLTQVETFRVGCIGAIGPQRDAPGGGRRGRHAARDGHSHLRSGDRVVLSTATNRVITERTAAYLGIPDLIATECEVAPDGVLSGRLRGAPNMREGKVTRLNAWLAGHGLGLKDCDSRFYSDSMNDLALLQAVRHPVVVDADERLAVEAARRGWPAISLRD